ncbi:MAG: hypothetical protein KDC03_24195, partial [Flavobacteriales bacterium]|nr:hypothetical protein [Flavobacteriales bacterium]
AYGDIINQKRVLTSYDLINKTLDKLDFDVSYFIVGRFKTSEVYNKLPFQADVEVVDPRLYDRPFDMRVVDPDHFELSYEGRDGVVTEVHRFEEWVTRDDLRLRVRQIRRFLPKDMEELTSSTYQFVRHNRGRLVNKYKYDMEVENLDYSSILQITVEDQVPEKAKLFLDSLSKGYIDYTLQSEFDINENTLSYIDRQLDEVTDILGRHEQELEEYKLNKDILDLNREENRYFQELVRFDNERRRLELMLESLDDLEDYVLNIGDEKLLPPSLYILEDDVFQKQTLNELYDMQMQRNRMLFEAKEDIEAVQQLDEVIRLTRANLLVYIGNTRTALRQKIGDVGGQIADYESLIRGVPKTQRDILNIERKVQVNEKLYLFLLEKRANTVIARAGIIPQTKVIETARSLGVVRPDKVKILYSFIVGGVVISLLVVFVRVMFYDRIENADQLKEVAHLPVFGEIIASEKAEENYAVVDSDPKAAITESFRTVRTNLEA